MSRHLYTLLMLLIYCILSVATSFTAPIQWEIENNNRIFKGPREQGRFFAGLCRYLDCSSEYGKNSKFGFDGCSFVRQDPLYCTKNRYKKIPPDSDNPTIFYWSPLNKEPQNFWRANSYNYGPKDDYIFGKTRTILLKVNLSELSAANDAKCSWKIDPVDTLYSSPSAEACEGFEKKGFKKNVSLDENYVGSFKVNLQVVRSNGEPLSFDRQIKLQDVLVVALGDSISSGEGIPHWFDNFEYKHPQGSDDRDLAPAHARWWDARCDRSLFAFSSQAMAVAAVQTSYENPDTQSSFTYLNFACSGAATNEGLLKSYVGRQTVSQIRAQYGQQPDDIYMGNPLPKQINQAEKNLCSDTTPAPGQEKCRHPDYVVMTTGGNEIHFGDIVRQAIEGCGGIFQESCLVDKVQDEIASLTNRYDEIFNAFYNDTEALRPKHVYVMEYFDITHDRDGNVCDDSPDAWNEQKRVLGPRWASDWGVAFVKASDAEKAYRDVVLPLNKHLSMLFGKQKYKDNHWMFLAGVLSQSKVRGWCARPSWTVTYDDAVARQGRAAGPGPDYKKDAYGTAHPNIFAQNFYAWRLRCQFAKDKVIPEKAVFHEGAGECPRGDNPP
jgi:hypothetical protein